MNENLKPFLAGFDLAGKRLASGKLQCYGWEGHEFSVIDEWPQEVELFGRIYTLENVIKGVEGYESGAYV